MEVLKTAKVKVIADNLKIEKLHDIDDRESALGSLNGDVSLTLGKIMKRTMQMSGNLVFSPTALYLALVLLTKITEGNTKKQIVYMLGIKEKDLSSVYGALECAASNITHLATSRISTSLWLNDRMDFDEKLLLHLNEKMNLVSYAGKMGSADMDAQIAEWVNKTTGNMLTDSAKVNTTKDTLLELLTTIYFQSRWDHDFDEEETKLGSFHPLIGKEVRCKFMNQMVSTAYHIGTKFTAITKSLFDGYDAIFALPNEGRYVDEVVQDFEWSQLVNTGRLSTTKQMLVDFSMPKFDISTKLDLKSVMKSFGVVDVFDSSVADFTPISTMSEVFLSKVEQSTRIKADERGIEATSCVESGVIVAGIPPKQDEVKLVLDRPFIFMIVSRDTVPVFVGKVENPCEK